MLKIHGPTYRYRGEILTDPTVIMVQDHHYDPQHGDHLRLLLDNSQCPPNQHLLVFDHVLRQDEYSNHPHICLPLLMAAECAEFNQNSIEPHWHHRQYAFNFMINKPRPHREILLNLVHDLPLDNYKHSLCWSGGYKSIPATDYRFGDEIVLDKGLLNGSYPNAITYKHLLKSNVFEPTAVSLITEPAFQERETILTEKTIMAIWSGTIPIWVGGWKCADTMRDFGFDVFDDVIDHSYQDLSDPINRCCQAVELNISVLRHAVDLTPFYPRLEHNLNLLRTNIWLQTVNDKVNDHLKGKDPKDLGLKLYAETYRKSLSLSHPAY